MKTIIIGLFALSIPSLVMAIPLTTALTCEQAKAIVLRQGSAVLYSAPNIFDRYVSSAASCAARETTQQAFALTKDMRLCPVGSICVQPDDTNGSL